MNQKNGNGAKEREYRDGKKLRFEKGKLPQLADSVVPKRNIRDWLSEKVAEKKEPRATSPRKRIGRLENGSIQEEIQANLGQKQKNIKDIWKKVINTVPSKRKFDSIRRGMSIIDPPEAGDQQNVFIASKKSL